MLTFESHLKQQGHEFIIGMDEAGRGPLAGPVVAAAVSLKSFHFTSPIRDSKHISPKQREQAFLEIFDKAYVGVGIISEAVIDRLNILEATYLAMTNAVNQLVVNLPDKIITQQDFNDRVYMLVDGNRFETDLPFSYRTVVKGDQTIYSISCASIVAKVIRDRILAAYDQVYPEYGFKQHKGYPTPQHKNALKRFGPSLIHRKSYHY